MSESPGAEEARKIVDDLEDDLVDVDQAQRDAGLDDSALDEPADDESPAVPGSPEPAD